MDGDTKSIYHTGGSDGLIMGLYMSVAFVLQAVVLGRPSVLSLVSGAMVLGIPVLAYALLRRGYREHPAQRQFSTVWMHGITIFICGSLILGLVQYVYMRFVQPGFIASMVQMVAETYKSMPGEDYQHMGEVMQRIVDKHMLPTPISFTFSMIWLVSFVGSLLSFVLTLLIMLTQRLRRPKQ